MVITQCLSRKGRKRKGKERKGTGRNGRVQTYTHARILDAVMCVLCEFVCVCVSTRCALTRLCDAAKQRKGYISTLSLSLSSDLPSILIILSHPILLRLYVQFRCISLPFFLFFTRLPYLCRSGPPLLDIYAPLVLYNAPILRS